LPDAEGFEPVTINDRAKPLDFSPPDFELMGYGWFIFHRPVAK